ncbi:transcriptional regulator [Halogeometricum borinquense]|uniref:Transcriptional regulator n=1 Tax=Halogeometricum borinquense TaxID=60847 RepID=A0A6C0UIA9_9EURY|nr:helix-turn-helix domain-containing protein [Halogeometricum borinquense]QIB75242.1 transcriptional regulator [Halogeometricum borinquense]QIQ75815.1 transcriptional regulator [Halogeometricum borinquense]
MSLLETEVPVRNVVTTDPEKAKALDNDVRVKILDMLADQEMAIGEIHEELARRGEKKVETTVRHHVNILKDAGLVEIARLEDASGGTLKYYKSNTRVFAYDLPAGSDDELNEVQETAREGITTLLKQLFRDHDEAIETVAREMQPCEYCETQHYEEFIVREVVNRALTDMSEDGTFETIAEHSR